MLPRAVAWRSYREREESTLSKDQRPAALALMMLPFASFSEPEARPGYARAKAFAARRSPMAWRAKSVWLRPVTSGPLHHLPA